MRLLFKQIDHYSRIKIKRRLEAKLVDKTKGLVKLQNKIPFVSSLFMPVAFLESSSPFIQKETVDGKSPFFET